MIADVSDATFDNDVLKSQQPVLVDFWAGWCGPCRAVAPIVEGVATSYEGKLKVLKLNVDQNSHTPARYGVRGIPALVLQRRQGHRPDRRLRTQGNDRPECRQGSRVSENSSSRAQQEEIKNEFLKEIARASKAESCRCPKLRAVLVEALIVHPDCFADDYSAESSRPLSEVEDELERTATFGVWLGDVLVGIGSVAPCRTPKRQHCGMVRNLYVREKFRHNGLAGLLLREILTHATSEVKQLETQVPLRCESAARLFEKFGFRMCGLLPTGLQVGYEEVDVWLMTRSLR